MTVGELEEYGMRRMDDHDVDQLLSTQDTGVLALPTDGAPSMRPLSFWFDGESTLYFPYVLGSTSRKAKLSDRATAARFLVYRTHTAFNWRSVLLAGTVDAVPEEKRAAVRDQMDVPWRPELFERASESVATSLYQFQIDDRTGIKQLELPPDLREGSVDEYRP